MRGAALLGRAVACTPSFSSSLSGYSHVAARHSLPLQRTACDSRRGFAAGGDSVWSIGTMMREAMGLTLPPGNRKACRNDALSTSRQHARPPSFLYSSDATAGNHRTSMPTAWSVVCPLSTSRVTSASCTAFHPALTSRTVAEA